MIQFSPHYTISDYEQWSGDWELWKGTAVAMTPSPFGKHQLVGANIIGEIRNQLRQNSCDCRVLYEIDWRVSDDTVLRPDVVVICHGLPEKWLDTAPTLIAEVLSASSKHKDRTAG